MNEAIIAYLKTLPEPFRSQAIENYDANLGKDRQIRSLKHALNWAFEWKNSPQGFKYWSEFTDSLPNVALESDIYNLEVAGKD